MYLHLNVTNGPTVFLLGLTYKNYLPAFEPTFLGK